MMGTIEEAWETWDQDCHAWVNTLLNRHPWEGPEGKKYFALEKRRRNRQYKSARALATASADAAALTLTMQDVAAIRARIAALGQAPVGK